jgi:Ras homolog gene family, member A
LTPLRDSEQPFVYGIRMYSRPYRFEFYDTASPEHYALLRPDLIVLCFDINNRSSLEHVQTNWRKEVYMHYAQQDYRMPVILLGLKRDLRKEEGMIWPQEAYRVAQEMRCDRYAECSAVTGELVREVFEDIAKVAAKTTTTAGGQSQGSACITM